MATSKPKRRKPEGINYNRITAQLGLMTLGLAVVAGVVGYLVRGTNGLWGALIGAAVVGAFFGASAVVMAKGKTPEAKARNLLIVWFVKIVALLGVLLLIEQAAWIDRPSFGLTVLAGIIGSLALEGRVVMSAREVPGGPLP
ncbi:MAG: hypothetical protein LBH68_06665 [Bifidobacteriaceae bacterium]|jgi:hypothetical protein|nr:hypothetical protein [Bifidobacteriaceae bacterium]